MTSSCFLSLHSLEIILSYNERPDNNHLTGTGKGRGITDRFAFRSWRLTWEFIWADLMRVMAIHRDDVSMSTSDGF